MHVLYLDPAFIGEPDLERARLGDGFVLELWRTDRAGAVTAAALARADALVLGRSDDPLDAGRVAQLRRCRVVSQASVGFDHIDLAACGAAGIPVCNTPDYGTMEVADHALALALALSRGIVAYDRKLRDRRIGWQAAAQGTVRRIWGLVFGVVGLGRIGLAAALRAQGFGLEVHFYDPYLVPGIERALGFARHAELRSLVAAADLLSLHAPLTAETGRMVDAAALAVAKPGLVLVNTARGPILDLDAVHRALEDGRLGGVGLDVLPVEPPDYDHPLLRAWAADEAWLDGRLIVTPHAAFFSPEGLLDMRRLAIDNVTAYCRHGTLRACVNRGALRERR